MTRILFLGDAVGACGRRLLSRKLWTLRKEFQADAAIVNAENSADGNGVTPDSAEELFYAGADVLTGGNHSLRRSEIFPLLEERGDLLRPLNLPRAVPGTGWHILTLPNGARLLTVSLLGQAFMDQRADSPFDALEALLTRLEGQFDLSVVDLHAESTGEKAALARAFDGRVSAVIGTHTHVQTADARVFPAGTAFISDVGMCGAVESILGCEIEGVVTRFQTGLPARFVQARGPACLCGVVLEADEATGKALSLTAFQQE